MSPGHYAQNEMDTHADMACPGSNWRVMELTGIECEVHLSLTVTSQQTTSQLQGVAWYGLIRHLDKTIS